MYYILKDSVLCSDINFIFQMRTGFFTPNYSVVDFLENSGVSKSKFL